MSCAADAEVSYVTKSTEETRIPLAEFKPGEPLPAMVYDSTGFPDHPGPKPYMPHKWRGSSVVNRLELELS